MPKGRGSNKKGRGPTPAKEQPQQRPQPNGMALELMVTKAQLEEMTVAKRQLQERVAELMRLLALVISRRRENSVTITPGQAQSALSRFDRINMEEDDDGNLTLELIETEEDADAPSES